MKGEEKRNKDVVVVQCQHQGETPQEFSLYQTHYGADLYDFTSTSLAAAGSVWFNTKAHNICCFQFYSGIFILIKSVAVIPQHCIKGNNPAELQRVQDHIHWEKMTGKSFSQCALTDMSTETIERELLVRLSAVR